MFANLSLTTRKPTVDSSDVRYTVLATSLLLVIIGCVSKKKILKEQLEHSGSFFHL